MFKKLQSALLALLVAAPLAAQASLIGQTASCDMQPATLWSCNPTSAVVTDPGAEFTLDLGTLGSFFSIDIGSSSILLTMIYEPTGLIMGAGEVLTLGGLSGILGASLDFTTASVGFDASDISFTGSSISLILNGSTWQLGQQALINISMAADPGNQVPEPGALALLGLGLAGLVLVRRRS